MTASSTSPTSSSGRTSGRRTASGSGGTGDSKASRELRRHDVDPSVVAPCCLDGSRLEWDAPRTAGRGAFGRHARVPLRHRRSRGNGIAFGWHAAATAGALADTSAAQAFSGRLAGVARRFLRREPGGGCGCVAPAGQRPVGCRVPEVARTRAAAAEGPGASPVREAACRRGQRFRGGHRAGRPAVRFPDGRRAGAVPVRLPVRRGRSARSRRTPSAAGFQRRRQQLVDTGNRARKPLVLLEERKSRGRDGIERYRRAWGLYVIATTARLPCWRSRCLIRASRARDATRSAATVERTRWR